MARDFNPKNEIQENGLSQAIVGTNKLHVINATESSLTDGQSHQYL